MGRIIIRKILFIITAFTICLNFPIPAFSECMDCEEVAKGGLPSRFLDKSVKKLPSGISIWDNEETIAALKHKDGKYLWVDTRPGSFLPIGTIKGAVNLVCDLKGVKIPDSDKPSAMTKDRLEAEIKKIDADAENVKVVFFCQGSRCHRSYNAALRSVNEYGMDPYKIVWHRPGYPSLEKYILFRPELKEKMVDYLQGDVLNY